MAQQSEADRNRVTRGVARALVALGVAAAVPTAAAHGGGHGPDIPQWVALAVLGVGVGVVAVSVYLGRSVADARPQALAGIFSGVVVTAAGAVGLVQLSPITTLAASRAPIDRAWYLPLTMLVGISIVVGSLVVGRIQWPKQPRYAGLGMLLGVWVSYPALFGENAYTNPVGYAVALAVPVAVAYVLWTDSRELLSRTLADARAKWFGVGTGVVAGLFFAFSMGMLSFVPEPGSGVNLSESFVTDAQVANPLVYWPAVEFFLHDVPLSGVLSVGMVGMVGLIAVLVGLNGALIADGWLCRGGSGSTEAATGSAAIAAPNACCCCGPILSELVVVSVGPSAAAPLYWLFIDVASPLGALFFVGSVAVLTGNLVRASD